MSSFATNAVCAHDTLCPRELIEETVNVMNRALHPPPTEQPAPQDRALSEKVSNGRTLRVVVFSGKDMAEKDEVAIRFDEDRVQIVKEEDASPGSEVRVTEEHLEDVASDPDSYIDEPMKLELVWLKDRMTAAEE